MADEIGRRAVVIVEMVAIETGKTGDTIAGATVPEYGAVEALGVGSIKVKAGLATITQQQTSAFSTTLITLRTHIIPSRKTKKIPIDTRVTTGGVARQAVLSALDALAIRQVEVIPDFAVDACRAV